ncbi:hypothetical protein PoB_005235500 [Plakobranchus ocellatus]|uniref:Uncharacterized protein n=1 Tax=Plakobranchus ocellatus TaxID=259542 RepID=A0AAV4C2J4_9GAST|nr:hypothetical protein PoB_005235500 [Plakobranchus ocellatus]
MPQNQKSISSQCGPLSLNKVLLHVPTRCPPSLKSACTLDRYAGRKRCPLTMRALSLETIAKHGREYALAYSDGSITGGTGNGATGSTSYGLMVILLRFVG